MVNKKRDVHVVPASAGWNVKRSNASRASSTHATKREALDAGRSLAKSDKVELVIHRRDGTIQDKDSFGNDPFPPRDKVR